MNAVLGLYRGDLAQQNDAVRNEFRLAIVSATVIVCLANGLAVRVATSITHDGLLGALLNTFGISAIVWFSIYNFCQLIKTGNLGTWTYKDRLIILLVFALLALPLSSLSWAGLAFVATFYLLKTDKDDKIHRAMMVALAIGLSQQWARWVSAPFLPTILNIDASLVSMLSGYQRYGNLVSAGDGSVTLEVLEGCSSFANVSLAFLAWVNARAYFGTRGLKRAAVFVTLSVLSVVFINTLRIAMIAFRPDLYDILHGSVGASCANILSTISIAGCSIYGARK